MNRSKVKKAKPLKAMQSTVTATALGYLRNSNLVQKSLLGVGMIICKVIVSHIGQKILSTSIEVQFASPRYSLMLQLG